MFKDRKEAGRLLAEELASFANRKEVLVLGIPRGGVVVAKVVSDRLKIPLDIIVVKKIHSSNNPELAIGAVGPEINSKAIVYWDDNIYQNLNVDNNSKNQGLKIKTVERKVREKLLRGGKKLPVLENKIAVLVDDGIATGATVLVCAKYLRKKRVKEIILAAPVIPKETYRYITKYFDRLIFLEVAEKFNAVGQFYKEFPQIEDWQVQNILR